MALMNVELVSLKSIKEGYKCWTMSCTSKIKAIDNMFLLQIFCYDTLMGVYLCCIFIATIVLQFKGDYCLLEHEWRASPFCPLLGVLFSFSSHGSLIGIASVSITRFLTCRSLVVDIKKSAVIIGSTIMTFLNLLHSVLPLLPVTAIQDIFRSGMFFTHLDKNPFFGKNPINRSRLNEVYKGLLHRDDNDVYKMLRDLRNTTSRDDIFDITEITYYGNTGLCVHNIFKHQDSYEIYKVLYCTSLFVLLSIVSITYILIIRKQKSCNVAPAGPERQENNEARLTLKVALMIGSQLICWIPFILTVLYFQYMTKKPASPMVFEVFELVMIPINSFLNPVFYSELYKKVVQMIWIKWRLVVSFCASNNI